MRLYFLVALIFPCFIYSISNGQRVVDSLWISKKECTFKNSKGYKIIVHLKEGDATHQSDNFYDLTEVIKLSDSAKLRIVEELLRFEGDTTLCCMGVTRYRHSMLEGCGGWPKSQRFSIQIDALFMINRICFPSASDLYSCHPVLYDTKLKQEINDEPEKMKCVFAEYKKWFKESKAKNKIGNYFPFNDGRYVWYGGKKSVYSKEE